MILVPQAHTGFCVRSLFPPIKIRKRRRGTQVLSRHQELKHGDPLVYLCYSLHHKQGYMREPGKPVIHHISLMRFEPLVGRYGIHLTLPYVIHQPANMDAYGVTASIGN